MDRLLWFIYTLINLTIMSIFSDASDGIVIVKIPNLTLQLDLVFTCGLSDNFHFLTDIYCDYN